MKIRATLFLSIFFISLSCFLIQPQAADKTDPAWTTIAVPTVWRRPPSGKLASKDGFAWYRCWVKVPESWKGKNLSLYVEPVDDARAVYFNGTQVGAAGTFPPKFRSGLSEKSQHRVPKNLVKPGELNFIALRVYYKDGRTNFNVAAPVLLNDKEAIRMEGNWEARGGDNLEWAKVPAQASKVVFDKVDQVDDVELYVKRRKGDHDPYPPKEALKTFKVPNDLKLDLMLSEPVVRQPLFINWDERGRMWVLQYLQYPNPAGLKMVSRDKYLRTVYDKVPPAPPNHFKGMDKITIHEDTDGDGIYDKHKTFLDGLSIMTSFARGRGGVWVLNPPYLLFYPDKNNDDVPDGDPVVHLAGFGIEDSHSVTNSLRWGPDGWLYAAQGSTVSAMIKRPGIDKVAKRSMGQLLWRYHPETKRYEIFAEGGGNTFGVEMDSKGRTFSGHNGGDTRGFHYVQGGYSRKGFNKHGSLSNPYAFGYFPPMKHHSVPRFTHNFIIYEGNTLPKQYHGRLFGIEPLQGQLVQSEFFAEGSTFQTKDLDRPVKTDDQWFRPVDIKVGPDGGIYFCDMYEQRIDHSSHYAGRVDRTSGRIYRLQGKDVKPLKSFDYSKLSSEQLVKVLGHENKWHRQVALRLLADRKDKSVIPMLKKQLENETGQLALESLWALSLSGGLDDRTAARLLDHAEPYVRLWTVRLLCDAKKVSPAIAKKLVDLAKRENYVQVRSQLACSAKRLPAKDALPIAAQLLTHDDDLKDPHLPLLIWWAIENKASSDRDAVVKLMSDPKLWQRDIVKQHLLERLMRRYAQSGSQNDLMTCAKLLELAPTKADAKPLLKGFELAVQGRSLPRLPEELLKALAKVGGASLELRVRQGETAAVNEALKLIANARTKKAHRLQLMQILGQINAKAATPVLLKVIEQSRDDQIRGTALTALQSRDDDTIGTQVTRMHNQFSKDVQKIAQEMLVSRVAWTKALLAAVDKGTIQKSAISQTIVRKMLLHEDKTLASQVKKHFGDLQGATTEQMRMELARLEKLILQGSGNPYDGRTLYSQHCAKCHRLFGNGGEIGPDLTSYQRTDLKRILLNVVNPSAEIREGFENYLVRTEDGRVMNGFLVDQDNQVLVLRTPEGQNRVIPQKKILDKRALPQSIMPQDVLKPLSDQQVRDLFAYLRSSQPLP